ncbi:MAG: hypothetical protein ACI9VR_004072, partial [Cognaticolwellia sp.]
MTWLMVVCHRRSVTGWRSGDRWNLGDGSLERDVV